MSPWTLLGWIIVASVGFSTLLGLALVVDSAQQELLPELRKARRLRRAKAGKQTCDWFNWVWEEPKVRVRMICDRKATHYAPSIMRFFCQEHSQDLRWLRPLHPPIPDKPKTRVVI